MYGIEAINAYNGWAQALTGACIVMTGLGILCFLISQLHKIVALFERKEVEKQAAPATVVTEETFPELCPSDLAEAAKLYRSITKSIGENFALPELYKACQTKNVPHPHLTIKCFREVGILVPSEGDTFSWA